MPVLAILASSPSTLRLFPTGGHSVPLTSSVVSTTGLAAITSLAPREVQRMYSRFGIKSDDYRSHYA